MLKVIVNYKAQSKVARLHKRIADIRQDTLHKLTTYLAKNHGQIVIEDLNVSGMLANHKLAKSIADMGLFEFRRQLDYKCQLYGSELIIADRWFPSSKTCSKCGCKKETLTLSDRIFKCSDCNFEIDRDLNASYNLARHCGLGGFPKEQMSQEAKIGRATAEFTSEEKVLPTVFVESENKTFSLISRFE